LHAAKGEAEATATCSFTAYPGLRPEKWTERGPPGYLSGNFAAKEAVRFSIRRVPEQPKMIE